MDSSEVNIPSKKRRQDFANGCPPSMGIPLNSSPEGAVGQPPSSRDDSKNSGKSVESTYLGASDAGRGGNSSSSFMSSMFSSFGDRGGSNGREGGASNSLSMLESFVLQKPTTGHFFNSIKDTIGTSPDQHNIVLFPETQSQPEPPSPISSRMGMVGDRIGMGGDRMGMAGDYGDNGSPVAESHAPKPKRSRSKKKNVAETVTTSEAYNPMAAQAGAGMYGGMMPGAHGLPQRMLESMSPQEREAYAQQMYQYQMMMMMGGAYNMAAYQQHQQQQQQQTQQSQGQSQGHAANNGRIDNKSSSDRNQNSAQDLSQKAGPDFMTGQSNPRDRVAMSMPQNYTQSPSMQEQYAYHQSGGNSSPHNFSNNRQQQDPSSLPVPSGLNDSGSIAIKFLDLERQMCSELKTLAFGDPVAYIYNPLEYAWEPHSTFVHKFCSSRKSVLFLGMNPGPFGMVQTGVPFGEVTYVRDWLQITGNVGKPPMEHPKRPVEGFNCTRNEVSGSRFWGYIQKKCQTPNRFFKSCFVHNICPLVFMNKDGKNLTPPDLAVSQRAPLNELCDRYLCEVVKLLGITLIVGIGKFAQERAKVALETIGVSGIRVETIMHPSPANPKANQGWEEVVDKQIHEIGVSEYLE